ncbi:MAG TPA: hypothetical protein VGT79_09345, partial [Xanthomonadaceae bacterium]|nr:hypothetical protein [Xanthomonadaceae bacterium]
IYLQAAIAAGKPGSTQPVLDFLKRTHFEDPAVHALAAQVASRIAAPIEHGSIRFAAAQPTTGAVQ